MDIADTAVRVGMFLIPFLFALSVHEYAHGFVAARLGDNTAKLMGRLTINPFAHADILGTFILPIIAITTGAPFFGWAKPVPVNDRNFKNRRAGMALVASAGPASNVIMAIIGTLIFAGTLRFFENATFSHAIVEFAKTFIMINLSLAFFNLIPIHPLDGGKIIAIFLTEKMNRKLEELQPVFSIVLIALFIFGGFGKIIFTPVIKTAEFMLSSSLTLFGVM